MLVIITILIILSKKYIVDVFKGTNIYFFSTKYISLIEPLI